ncbi:hypothetical protein KJ657_01500 [Patescibacteria group bacterium]|nr:hypothetical protein [Patescibacteria group bacterium]MBU1015744.1 hypothetical protein [Patescibacteria group bacterium]MBU1685506.1 hypothetical protein [Patescibacteria group bacterium]MBU1938708.1 hypothetical protein [Patescibacteria group bacterium]
MGSEGHRQHQIQLKNLRENERVLHNCSSHSTYHLKIHTFYVLGLLIPAIGLIFLSPSGATRNTIMTAWFLFSCYGLILTTYYFVKGVNFEMGGCVITNQRVLRFGYTGLWQAVEREILPKNIEDFKIIKRGLMSLFFGTANIYFYTSNHQTDVLRFIIEPEKVSEAYASMMKAASNQPYSQQPAWSGPSQTAVVNDIKPENSVNAPTGILRSEGEK